MGDSSNKYADELARILEYWSNVAYNHERELFYGQVSDNNEPCHDADLGSVLYSRILWSYSAAYNLTGNKAYIILAEKCFAWLSNQFWDEIHGGVYWTIHPNGWPTDTKKQIYALAFALYGFSEYYRATKNLRAFQLAQQLYHLIEEHSFDAIHGGYYEAFARDWAGLNDVRLSTKDGNEQKTMNTNLHVLEAYTNFYQIWPNALLKGQIEKLIYAFKDHFVGGDGHLILFFDELWNIRSSTISFGHDIEASWLLLKAAKAIGVNTLTVEVQKLSLKMARAAIEGIGPDGGLAYEYEPGHKLLMDDKHWWVQAEAAVGLYAAWQLTGDPEYLARFDKNWQFIENYITDKEYGEWHWGVTANQQPMAGQYKAGLWKCPYHNTRCCIELIKRTAV